MRNVEIFVVAMLTLGLALPLGLWLGMTYRYEVSESGPWRVAVVEVRDVSNGSWQFTRGLENPTNFSLMLSFTVEPSGLVECSVDTLQPFETVDATFSLTVDSPFPENYMIYVRGDRIET